MRVRRSTTPFGPSLAGGAAAAVMMLLLTTDVGVGCDVGICLIRLGRRRTTRRVVFQNRRILGAGIRAGGIRCRFGSGRTNTLEEAHAAMVLIRLFLVLFPLVFVGTNLKQSHGVLKHSSMTMGMDYPTSPCK